MLKSLLHIEQLAFVVLLYCLHAMSFFALGGGVRGGVVASIRSSLPIRGGSNHPRKRTASGGNKPGGKGKKDAKRNLFVQLLAQRHRIADAMKPKKEVLHPDLAQEIKKRKIAPPTKEKLYQDRLLCEEWAGHTAAIYTHHNHIMKGMLDCRMKALKELRAVSEKLYRAAIAANPSFLPLRIKARPETPPLPGYQPPEYVADKTVGAKVK